MTNAPGRKTPRRSTWWSASTPTARARATGLPRHRHRRPAARKRRPGSLQLAEAIRDGFVAAGFAPSNYLGADGIDLRSDLTGLNLSEKPKALVEFGNMTDSADIAVLRSEDGRARMADAVVAGIEAALAARG